MARSRAIDVLFEFDVPQTWQDLSAPLPLHAPGEHDVWFDQVHPQHSRPSADLAREAAVLVRKLQEKEQQHKDAPTKNKANRSSGGKENFLRPKTGADGQTRPKLRKWQERTKPTGRAERRTPDERVQMAIKKAKVVQERRRKPLADARNRLNVAGREQRTLPSNEKKTVRDWRELLKRHNKKFKAMHTYEPPQHSVREVKQWERATKKTYYALSAEERVQANEEIAVWKQRQANQRQ